MSRLLFKTVLSRSALLLTGLLVTALPGCHKQVKEDSRPKGQSEKPARAGDPLRQVDCAAYQRKNQDKFIIVFNTQSRPAHVPRDYTYSSVPVFVCVDNIDYRFKYGVSVNLKDLAPVRTALDELTGAADSKDGSSGIQKSGRLPDLALQLEVKQQLELARLIARLNGPEPVLYPDARDAYEKLLSYDTSAWEDGWRQLLQYTVSHLLTAGQNLIRIGTGKDKEVEILIKGSQLDLAPESVRQFLAAQAEIERREQEWQSARQKASDANGTNKKTLENLKAQLAELEKLTPQTSALKAQIERLNEQLKETSAKLKAAYDELHNLELKALESKQAAEASRDAAQKAIGKSSELKLKYAEAKELDRVTIQSRSLTYIRGSLGLAYTTLQNRSYSLGPNDVGAQVIRSNTDLQMLAMLVLSHYWCGADLRETKQPWDRSRSCWAANLAPTFALGVPLNKNPLENILIGMQWSPVPGFGLLTGVHVGRVNALRPGFAEGNAPPPDSSFRIEDAAAQKTAVGFSIGGTLTDALLIRLIRGLIP